jgi:prepilin-type N-terminal cleavage/methylation domain-containing protein
MTRRTVQPCRAAFTLVELLVVIAIIAILMGLIGAAYFWFVSGQGVKNTQARIQGIDEIFQKHWNKVVNDAKKETPSPGVYSLAGGDPGRAQVIWVKARLMEAFPMRFDEITNSPLYGSNPATAIIPAGKRKFIESYKKNIPSSLPGSHKVETESAACLLMALSINRLGGGEIADLERWTADTDNDSIPELVDDWRQPLYFFRFPVGYDVNTSVPPVPPIININNDFRNSAPPANNAAAAKFRDPLDPFGKLLDPNWYATPSRTTFESIFHNISGDRDNGQLTNYAANYTIPVIVSAGPDGVIGLTTQSTGAATGAKATMAIQPPPPAPKPPTEPDNIYSYKLRVGGGLK